LFSFIGLGIFLLLNFFKPNVRKSGQHRSSYALGL